MCLSVTVSTQATESLSCAKYGSAEIDLSQNENLDQPFRCQSGDIMYYVYLQSV